MDIELGARHERHAPGSVRPSRTGRTSRRIALGLAAALLAGATACSSSTTRSTGATGSGAAASSAASTTSTEPPADDTAPAPSSTPTDPSTTTSTVAPKPPIEVPPPPAVAAPTGTIDEQVQTILAGFDGDGEQRTASVLAAFSGAQLPIIGADGHSLTTATDDPAGLRWDLIWSAASLSNGAGRVALSDIVRLLGFVNPASTFDVVAATAELLTGLRAALASGAADGTSTGPAFLAHLIAADAAATNGVDFTDPTVSGDQLLVHWQTSMLVTAAALHALYEGFADAGLLASGTPAGESGPARPVHSRATDSTTGATATELEDCADDGAGGWLLWFGSKVIGGISAPGLPFAWKGLFATLIDVGIDRGAITLSADELAAATGTLKLLGGAAGVLNVVLFLVQLAGQKGSATLDGSGPLVRSKKTSNGESRTIRLSVSNGDEDPRAVTARNCILALAVALGNNAQQTSGPAAGVNVEVAGAAGFAEGLDSYNSLVLFGPATFEPIQTADESGTITIPVQGRGQHEDLDEPLNPVAKEFSITARASLDPTTASTVARSFADSLLCSGVGLGGDGGDIAAECNNALIDILKQFRWDLGEFTFPLTDWTQPGWVVDAPVGPFQMTGGKCYGDDGPWSVEIQGSLGGLVYHSELRFNIDPQTLSGTYDLVGTFSGDGVSLGQTGTGNVVLIHDADGAAHLEFQAISGGWNTPVGSVGGVFDGGASIPLLPATTECVD